jgi:hypothetical protein
MGKNNNKERGPPREKNIKIKLPSISLGERKRKPFHKGLNKAKKRNDRLFDYIQKQVQDLGADL